MSSKKQLRFPMFLKFLLACLLLAGLLLIGGTLVVKEKSTFSNRGNFLVKHLRRYQFYQETVGRGITGTLELVVADSALRSALAGTGPATPIVPQPPAPPPVLEAKDNTELATVGKALYDRLSSENSIRTDLFVVFDVTGRLLWAPKGTTLDPKQLTSIAAVEKARTGAPFAHRVQVIGTSAYVASALPVMSPGGAHPILGGVLVGVKLQRMVAEYAEQSDEVDELRYRPVLLDGPVVLASALPGTVTDAARAMQPDKLVKVTVGEDTREVIRLKDHDYDFFAEEIDGYKNGDAVTVGKLFITRSRARVVDPASSLPWLEIGVGIALSLLIATGLAIWVTRPIKQMVKQSRDLLAGDTDLTQRIVVSSRDETADLADNINQVFARVHTLASGVQNAAFQVGASSAEISAASREMLGGLKDQTLKIESSTTAVTELSASIQTVAGNAAQATQVAEQSTTAVNSAVSRMSQIQSSVDDAAEKMRELAESSKRIGNIVEVIRQISEQTSMLALNASIEAAHAGEQGRGFAVVADEVSSLARRVGQSAKDIEALIQTVKEQTQAAITSMERGAQDVGSGSEAVTSTLTGLGQLITVVKETASAVQEQAMVSDEIARNMDAVRHIATEVLSGSEESVVQSERLHELAFELEESIAGFNLDGSRLGSATKRVDNGGKRTLPAGDKQIAKAKPAPRDQASD
ncbi:MAG: methyl-accepting chemotaxis protein [Deltaproteobacteria bacterium]|nr:methyl-accepting chemotaxis protein [Deltaproteobacteria bacterium]